MNKKRRTELAAIATKIADAREELEAIRDEEQEAYDNMPESLQTSQRGEAAESAIGEIDSALSSLEEAINSLEGCTSP